MIETAERVGSLRSPQSGAMAGAASMALWTTVCLLGLQEPGAGAEAWSVSASANKSVYLLREPVLVTIEIKNTSQTRQLLTLFGPRAVIVSRDGGEPATYGPFLTSEEQEADRVRAAVAIAPGESHRWPLWLVLGRAPEKAGWEFLFPAAGKYRVAIGDVALTGKDAEVGFEVREPGPAEDKAAMEAFSVAAASVFLGETAPRFADAGLPALRAIAGERAETPYGPYAAIAVAEHLWRKSGGFEVDFRQYKRHLDVIIEKHREHFLREKALYLLARGYAFQRGKKSEVARVAAQLAREYPQGEYLPKVEREFGVRPGQKFEEKPQVPRQAPGATKLTLPGLEKIPAGPREVCEAYWRAAAAQKLDDALACLREDFFGHGGSKARQKERWEWGWEHYNVESLTVQVDRAEAVASYARPRSLGGPEKSWSGEICLVYSRVSATVVSLRTGAKETQAGPPSETALIRDGGKWFIISEYTETRNLKAGLLAQQFDGQLRRSFETAKVWTGEKELVLHDELRSRLAKDGAAKLSWQSMGLTMAGKERDAPQLVGEVTVQSLGGAKGTEPARFTVTLSFVLDQERLRLVGIETRAGESKPPE